MEPPEHEKSPQPDRRLRRQQLCPQPTTGQSLQERRQDLQQLVRPIVLIATIVHQRDIAALHGAQPLLNAVSRAEWTPIDCADIPQHHSLTAALRFITHARARTTVRRTIEARFDSQHIAQGFRAVANLCACCSLRHEPRMPMAERVIADGVPGGMNPPHQLGGALRLFADCKKRGAHLRPFEHIEHTRRPLRIRTVIEGEIEGARHGQPSFNLPMLRDKASRVSQYRRGSADSRPRMRAAGANTHINILK